MNNNCTIYLTRHGETDWNAQKLLQGHSDIPLNGRGELQAKVLGEQFENINFEAAFSSDLIRAKRTAEIIIFEKKLAVITTKALRERLFGRFEGQHASNLRKVFDEFINVSIKQQKESEFDDIENNEEIIFRLIPFIREVAVGYPGKNVLMVAHGGLIKVFLDHIGHKIPTYAEKPMKNTGYIIIESDGVEFEVKEDRLF